MRVWVVTFAILFMGVEAWMWIEHFILPLPVHILGGAFLAIASNYDKGTMSSLTQKLQGSKEPLTQTATLIEQINIFKAEKLAQSALPPGDK